MCFPFLGGYAGSPGFAGKSPPSKPLLVVTDIGCTKLWRNDDRPGGQTAIVVLLKWLGIVPVGRLRRRQSRGGLRIRTRSSSASCSSGVPTNRSVCYGSPVHCWLHVNRVLRQRDICGMVVHRKHLDEERSDEVSASYDIRRSSFWL